MKNSRAEITKIWEINRACPQGRFAWVLGFIGGNGIPWLRCDFPAEQDAETKIQELGKKYGVAFEITRITGHFSLALAPENMDAAAKTALNEMRDRQRRFLGEL